MLQTTQTHLIIDCTKWCRADLRTRPADQIHRMIECVLGTERKAEVMRHTNLLQLIHEYSSENRPVENVAFANHQGRNL